MSATIPKTPLKFAILGAGMIAWDEFGYLPNLGALAGKAEVVAIADIVSARAKATAEKYGIPQYFDSLEKMLAFGDFDICLNLTPIPVHAATSKKILEAGKHLISEKPIASSMEEANELIEIAERMGVLYHSAPAHALYAKHNAALAVIKEGKIGKVAFARVRSSHAGPGGGAQGWPMDPTWFYQEGSGPLFDMGVYGIHEITFLLGPVKQVTGFAGITDQFRTVRGSGEYAGLQIEVTTADNNLFLLDFGHSTYAVVDASFNVLASRSPKIEIFGRKGVIALHERPENPLEVFLTDIRPGEDGWDDPANYPHATSEREVALRRAILMDHMVDCLRDGVPSKTSALHARHALEVMLAVKKSSDEKRTIQIETTF